jgi:hypothetical protein
MIEPFPPEYDNEPLFIPIQTTEAAELDIVPATVVASTIISLVCPDKTVIQFGVDPVLVIVVKDRVTVPAVFKVSGKVNVPNQYW